MSNPDLLDRAIIGNVRRLPGRAVAALTLLLYPGAVLLLPLALRWTPLQLVEANVLEVSFSDVPAGWEDRLKTLPEVDSVNGHDHSFKISSKNGPATTMALLDAAAASHVTVHSLSVASTTLDDVFVHYTGRDLRDALQEASPQDSQFMLRRP